MIAGFAIGMFLGTAVTGLAWWCTFKLRTKVGRSSGEVPVLLQEDRAVISDQFAAHAVAVQKQVSEYADVLAGNDPVLRERLRQIEIGGQPC